MADRNHDAAAEGSSRLLLEASPQPSWVFESDTLAFLAVNEAALTHFGYSREEFLRMSLKDVYPPEGAADLFDQVSRFLGESRSTRREIGVRAHRTKAGRHIDVEASWSRFTFGGKDAVLAVLNDVTERTLAEETLWEREAQLRRIVTAAPIILWATDRDGVFTLSEGRGLAALGFKPGEAVGRAASELYGGHPEVLDHIRRALSGEALTAVVEVGGLTFESHYAPLRGPSGEIVGVTGIATDITERKRSEALQSALYRIAQSSGTVEKLDLLYPVIHEIVRNLMPARNFYIALYDEARRLLSFPYWVDEMDAKPQARELGKGLTDYVLTTGQTLLASPEMFSELEQRNEVRLLGAPSLDWLGVPLKAGQRTLGVLVVQSYTESVRYGEREKELLAFVSQHIADAIERKRAEEALRASEERFSKAFQASPAPMAISSFAEGRYLDVNESFLRLTGYSRKEVLGSTAVDLTFWGDAEARAQALERLRQQPSLPNVEASIRTKAGEVRDVLFSLEKVELRGEACLLSISHDITERKKAEEALASSELRYRRLFETAKDGILLVEPETGQITDVNPFLAELLGYSHEELLGKTLWEIGSLRDVAASRAAFDEWRERQYVRYEDLPLVTKDGRRLAVEFVSNVYPVDGSKVIQCNIRDITKSRQADAALRESESRLVQAQHLAKLGSWAWDMSSDRVTWSEELFRIYGIGPQDFDGTVRAYLGRVHPDDRERASQIIEQALRDRSTFSFEERVVRPDGEVRWLHSSGEVVVDAAGQAVRMIGVCHDVTEQKHLEAQLRQSQKMEAVGRLAGGIAHDFNNLLGVITGYSELLQKDMGVNHPGFRRAEQIQKAADRAATLTQQLLAFSRQQILQPTILDVNAVVTEVEGMLRRLIGEDVELITVLDPGLGRVTADPGQLAQVIMNLAVNARDAMPHGGKLIIETANTELGAAFVRAHPGSETGPHVRLDVRDTGHGMDPETVSHIFEPFFTTKETGKGTGLGLATTYGIVKQSSGYVAVQSEPGGGSTFSIYLPRLDEAIKEAKKAAFPALGRGSETILLVEDEVSLRTVVREMLEDAGYVVLESTTPEDAISAGSAHKGRINLLLTDVVMPRMNGAQLAERLVGIRPEVRVLFMSGYTDEAIGHHGALVPGTHFIQKPFTAAALLRKVRDVLDEGTAL